MHRGALLRYGLLGLPLAFGALPIYIYVPDFYARGSLLGLSAIGAILLLTRLLDAIADPCFGWLVDRQPRRRMLLIGLLPFAAGFCALFLLPDFARANPGLWLFVALATCTLGFSVVMIAYQAWGGDLGENTAQRLQLTGAREGFILAGVVIASLIPTLLADDPVTGMRALPWCLLGFLLIALLALHKLPDGRQTVSTTPLLPRLRAALSDVVYRRLLAVFFANGVASAFPATLFVFYVSDVLGAPDKTGLLLGCYFMAAALAVPMWVRCARRLGRPVTWMLSMGLAILSFTGAAFLGAGDWGWFLVVCLVSGMAVGTDLTIPASIVADLGEARGMTGTYFGVWNLIAKINLALAAGIALPLLSLLGYVPGANTGLPMLVGTYVLLPVLLKSVALSLLYRWRQPLAICA